MKEIVISFTLLIAFSLNANVQTKGTKGKSYQDLIVFVDTLSVELVCTFLIPFDEKETSIKLVIHMLLVDFHSISSQLE